MLQKYGPVTTLWRCNWDNVTTSDWHRCRYQHKEFRGRLVQGYDFVDNDFNANDGNGHGTHVVSIAAANDGRITGVAYDADIMLIRVLDDSGSGSLPMWLRHTLTDMGADVINLSLGGGGYSQACLMQWSMHHKGTVVVMAAGNSGGSSPDHPAAHARHYGIAVELQISIKTSHNFQIVQETKGWITSQRLESIFIRRLRVVDTLDPFVSLWPHPMWRG